VETRAAARTADTLPMLDGQIFETLVRLNDRGEPEPWLATSWTHEPDQKRWVFAARPNVMLHTGVVWNPGMIAIPDDRPIEQILRDLARPRSAVVVKADDGSLAGTGPFKIARWDADKSATLAAHDGYWGGRPFLDTIEIQMGRGLSDQALDLEVGKADAVEVPLTELRRLRQRGTAISVTQPTETLALVFENARVSDSAREALALSIDRAAIHNVLLQRQGEISGALLPKWLSGYAFLFATERNVARARQLAAGQTISFGYDRQDALIRAIAERVAVNASESGIALRATTGPADVRLTRLPISSRDPMTALEDLASIQKASVTGSAYETERAMLAGFRVIPLFHLPLAWALNPHVRNGPRLADVWLDPREKP
jgi:MarR-like DNA-binding transcriptional regulator SgrR of sgrS sRNA